MRDTFCIPPFTQLHTIQGRNIMFGFPWKSTTMFLELTCPCILLFPFNFSYKNLCSKALNSFGRLSALQPNDIRMWCPPIFPKRTWTSCATKIDCHSLVQVLEIANAVGTLSLRYMKSLLHALRSCNSGSFLTVRCNGMRQVGNVG